ncbi:mechanosensitive ion channel domain-containing protein [Vibrio sp. SCSIO 43136]|uniref:mechanosensitive ion channel family protein n=1 Tax=Vibrio sp. SCSIO 43136 TaxID=2819101 RepID=UPI0020752DAA|nr:mechanosensitive ion channel domain-containing protein [Vibrio sp. SCSIO 43136]USD66668.1 mechanosensitive ion channel [Vibrio sp. SCSIO 43136]
MARSLPLLLAFALLVFSSLVLANQTNRLQTLSKELEVLAASIEQTKGSEREAVLLQLFQVNTELRRVLADSFRNKTITSAEFIKQVRTQEQYVNGTFTYLKSTAQKLLSQIDEAKVEDRLPILSNYKEAQTILDGLYLVSLQNTRWLAQAGLDEEATQARKLLEERLSNRLRQSSASSEYLSQQIEILNQQISSSPDSEKASLELKRLVVNQRLDIATDTLSAMINVAGQLGQDTSEYKKQLFEITGDITQDLLDVQVIQAIAFSWMSSVGDWMSNNLSQVLIQLMVFGAVLLTTWFVARLVKKLVSNLVATEKLGLSTLMQNFFESISTKGVWFLGILMALSQIGLNLTPVLTGFGIAGVVIGFALQDTLSNFAAGMMLLIYRPFDVGDFVHAGGVDGKVSSMSLVNTTIKTFDNQIIIVPNGKIWGDVIKNVTHERVRRVDMVFGIGYGDDLLKAETILTEIVTSHPSVLRSPEPNVKVHTLNTSSVDFIVRPWVKTDDYWDVYWDVTKTVKLRFDQEGISIPFPQQDVHLHMVKDDNG